MLLELKVKNLGIIEDMTWRLSAGLNVVTGETGAGKSLVVDAVETLLSGRADEEVIRFGAPEMIIEGVFSLPEGEKFQELRDMLAEKELDADEKTLVISCVIRRRSPAVIRLNGRAVPRSLLQKMGRLLVDIHGQSEHLSLQNAKTHLDYIDSYAHTIAMRSNFGMKAAELHGVEQELVSITKDDKDRVRREEFLHFQIGEITQARLREGEEEALQKDLAIVSSAEKLKELASGVYRALYEEDSVRDSPSALDKLGEAVQAMKKLAELDSSLAPHLKILEDSANGLAETAHDIHRYGERVNYDPQRLVDIDTRLELIRNLKRKYGQTISDILGYQERAERELTALTDSTQRRSELEAARNRLRMELGRMAVTLSEERVAAAKRLVKAVKSELDDLNMPHVVFEVSIKQLSDPEGIPFSEGNSVAFGNEGSDQVEFMVSTNPGEPIRPLAKISSTGEISRFTLALKSALSDADRIPVLIFDEVDIGIGGRSGEIIGKKLWGLSQRHQVVCVTHLPQIAAFGDVHFTVRKVATGTRTTSMLETVENELRLQELATMLTGTPNAESSLDSARELMRKADRWKETKKGISNT